jgi:hypothetical protein
MRGLLPFALSTVCASAQFVTPVPSVMPSWLEPYPGASVQVRRVGNTAESSYTTAAPARDVLAHFRTLFASAGVAFEPSPAGFGFLIRAAIPECDLDIVISRDPDTKVKVTCSPRLASTERILDRQARERAAQSQNDPMKRFDTPVYPQARAPQPPLVWPSWLVRVDGDRLAVKTFPGQLKSSFLSSSPREAIQAFYADLLSSQGYRVTQGLAAVPEQFGSFVEATADPDGQLHRRVIRVKIRPAGPNFTVEISLQ